MGFLDDEQEYEEVECGSRYINFLRRKRNIRDELYADYLSLSKEFEDNEKQDSNIKSKRETELLKRILKEE